MSRLVTPPGAPQQPLVIPETRTSGLTSDLNTPQHPFLGETTPLPSQVVLNVPATAKFLMPTTESVIVFEAQDMLPDEVPHVQVAGTGTVAEEVVMPQVLRSDAPMAKQVAMQRVKTTSRRRMIDRYVSEDVC